jgi:hypothetical protein
MSIPVVIQTNWLMSKQNTDKKRKKKCKQMPYTNYREIIHLYVYIYVKGTKVLVIYSSFFFFFIAFVHFFSLLYTRFFFRSSQTEKNKWLLEPKITKCTYVRVRALLFSFRSFLSFFTSTTSTPLDC